MTQIKKRSLCFILLAFIFSGFLFQCSDDAEADPQPEPDEDTDSRGDEQAAVKAIACSTCTYVIPANTGTIDGKALGIKPGDVICLNAASKYGSLTFKNI